MNWLERQLEGSIGFIFETALFGLFWFILDAVVLALLASVVYAVVFREGCR